MAKSPTRKERITIRLSPAQMQCLKELTESLNTSYSMMVRSIIQDFLARNEDVLERIITNKSNNHALHQLAEEDTED